MDFEPLRHYMRALREKGVPGLELTVCRDHEVLFHECLGFSDREGKRPACPSDRYWLFSCTKPVTAAAAMAALEEGLFSLEDPVSRYLPAYKDAYLMENGIRVPLKHTMTIRHLLTMSAGLDYNRDRESIARLQRENPLATTADFCEAFAEEPLCFEPGERFQYSLCHDVLGGVIERASGMSFRDYMKLKILDPLGMTDTDFCTQGIPDRIASKYAFNPETKAVSPFEGNSFNLGVNYYSGGAGLFSTASDYLKFADAMACGGVSAEGVRVLKTETIDLMRSEQIHTAVVNNNFTCTCGSDYGYGLGVRTRIAFEHGVRSAPGEFGWDGAAGADILIDPEHRLSMTYMQHVHSWPSMLGIVHLQIRDLLYPALGL